MSIRELAYTPRLKRLRVIMTEGEEVYFETLLTRHDNWFEMPDRMIALLAELLSITQGVEIMDEQTKVIYEQPPERIFADQIIEVIQLGRALLHLAREAKYTLDGNPSILQMIEAAKETTDLIGKSGLDKASMGAILLFMADFSEWLHKDLGGGVTPEMVIMGPADYEQAQNLQSVPAVEEGVV